MDIDPIPPIRLIGKPIAKKITIHNKAALAQSALLNGVELENAQTGSMMMLTTGMKVSRKVSIQLPTLTGTLLFPCIWDLLV